jgi:hypothetical protein
VRRINLETLDIDMHRAVPDATAEHFHEWCASTGLMSHRSIGAWDFVIGVTAIGKDNSTVHLN